MTFTSLRTVEPAFMSNEKYTKSKRPRGLHKNLTDCCYSLANLALIVGCIVALVFLALFFFDETLYEFSEHLLGLRFYRQLIFIMISLAFVLLIPLFNTVNACFLRDPSRASLGAKLFYQLVMIALMFVGLALIAQSIRQGNVDPQLAIELRRHMKFRYDNDFSYMLIDDVQEEYQCCDELWYRANYFDKLPLTCYRRSPTGPAYTLSWGRDCSTVISQLVSGRSVVIACCLVGILVALAILCGLDALECMLISGNKSSVYNVEAREASRSPAAGGSLATESNNNDDDDDDSDDEDEDDKETLRRPHLSGNQDNQQTRPLKLYSGEREEFRSATASTAPSSLLRSSLRAQRPAQQQVSTDMDQSGTFELGRPLLERDRPALYRDPYNSMGGSVYQATTEPILRARAHYAPGGARTQSPLFVGGGGGGGSSSIRRIDGSDDDSDFKSEHSDQEGDLVTSTRQTHLSESRQSANSTRSGKLSSLERDTQTRRSSLSVRFAQ